MKCTLFILAFLSVQTTFAQDSTLAQEIDTSVYEFPDVVAEFPGGEFELNRWIANNVYYPQECIENDEGGKVFFTFIVEADGCITHIKIKRGISDRLDEEVIKLIQKMPKWIPAKSSGVAVRSRQFDWISFSYQ